MTAEPATADVVLPLVAEAACEHTMSAIGYHPLYATSRSTPAEFAASAYVWDMVSDQIAWEANVHTVLGLADTTSITTGQTFSMLIAAEHVSRRASAIGANAVVDATHGATYRVQYRIEPLGPRSQASLWVEDIGRWWSDENGNPIRARGVIRVVSESQRIEQRMVTFNDHDELTGQLNRLRLTDALDTIFQRSRANNTPFAFLMVAVNNLAMVNETFGYEVGDEVITAVGHLIRAKLRGGDTIGRYSSNKFGIIVNDCTAEAMCTAASRYIAAVQGTSIRTTACQLTATLAIGGVLLPAQASTTSQAIGHSLQALDVARTRIDENFAAFEPNLARESLRRRNIKMADELISALDENRLRLVLQPIVDATTHAPSSFECLLRLQRRETGELISAGQFIQVGEQLGLARLIDRRTLKLAMALLEQHHDIKLSINVSGLTCLDHDWVSKLQQLIGGRRAIAERLTIEITETVALADLDQSSTFVDTLKELGCKVALDDFGAGYTSFKNLKHLAVDVVKIDGAFVKNVVDDPADQIFLKTLASLAHSFNMATVAEWVGDAQTAEICRAAGITKLQGFHFGQPFEPSELPAYLATKRASIG